MEELLAESFKDVPREKLKMAIKIAEEKVPKDKAYFVKKLAYVILLLTKKIEPGKEEKKTKE